MRQPRPVAEVPVQKVVGEVMTWQHDVLAVEEPLALTLDYTADGQRQVQALTVTMRTPGDDEDLALGFLITEGIIRSAEEVVAFERRGQRGCSRSNEMTVVLREGVAVDVARLQRHFYTTSSCGVCGKTSLEALAVLSPPVLAAGPRVTPEVLHALPDALRGGQAVFGCTGGLHAAARFTPSGHLVALREDVGRHNAMDKLIGAAACAGGLPFDGAVVLLSGRLSFELVQKGLMAGVGVLAAVGAPSSLAVALAERYGMTLVGFLREGRYNVYTAPERVALASAQPQRMQAEAAW